MTPQGPFFDLSFWKDFVANGSATVLGLVLGIPFGLFLSRRSQALAEASGKRRDLELAATRRRQVLTSLATELNANLSAIEGLSDFFWNIDFRDNLDDHADAYLRKGLLRTATWEAFSDGGLLRWIEDPRALDTLSQVYHTVRTLNRHIDKLFEVTYVGGPSASIYVLSAIKSTLRKALSDAKAPLEAAISVAKATGA